MLNDIEIIDSYNNDWTEICKYQYLTEEFMTKYYNKLDYYEIAEYQKLSEGFIMKYHKKLYNYKLFIYQKLNTEILEYLHKMHIFGNTQWYNIARHQDLKESFILKYKDKFDFDVITQNQNLTEEFIFNNLELFTTWGRIKCLLARKIINKDSIVYKTLLLNTM